MQAIILVGGLGTRLRALVPHVPKPMAPIAQKPFLAYLLDYLIIQGIKRVTFSAHHMAACIQDFFQNQYRGLEIGYAIEPKPLGTGGAIVHALMQVETNEPIFVLNGDTLVKFNYQALYDYHRHQKSTLTVALHTVNDCSRYGRVIIDKDVMIGFLAKGAVGAGLINAGVYLLEPHLFNEFKLPEVFSFEQDFLLHHLIVLKPKVWVTNDYFIDIGVPADYARALMDLTAV